MVLIDNNKQKGNTGLALAIAYFGSNGYTVSVPLNDTQWYDIVVEKDGLLQTVQCKFTSSKDREVKLVSRGGTKGEKYDSILNHPVDILFCSDEDMNLFLIPMQDLIRAGNTNAIKLRKEYSANSNFNTCHYIVSI